MSKDILVKKSGIEGKGVFAKREFTNGEVVLKWNNPHELTLKEIRGLLKKDKKYISCFKGKCVLMQAPEKYVNHSCEANTYARNFCDIAKRNIKAGEEITADYTKEVPDLNLKCKCGSKKCKGIIKT